MGFIKAFKGAIGGTFADQWKDFLTRHSGKTSPLSGMSLARDR